MLKLVNNYVYCETDQVSCYQSMNEKRLRTPLCHIQGNASSILWKAWAFVMWVFYLECSCCVWFTPCRYPELSFYMNSAYWSFTAKIVIYFCKCAVEAIIQLKVPENVNNLKVAGFQASVMNQMRSNSTGLLCSK